MGSVAVSSTCVHQCVVGLSKDLIQEKLNAALLTEEENVALGGMKRWRNLSDSFFGEDVYDHNHFELPEPYGTVLHFQYE